MHGKRNKAIGWTIGWKNMLEYSRKSVYVNQKKALIGWRSVYWSFLLLTCQVAMSLVASSITVYSRALWEVSSLKWVGRTVLFLEARSKNVLSSPSQFLGNTCALWLLAPHSCYLHSSASVVTSLSYRWTSSPAFLWGSLWLHQTLSYISELSSHPEVFPSLHHTYKVSLTK